jgi:hypothetical protein
LKVEKLKKLAVGRGQTRKQKLKTETLKTEIGSIVKTPDWER